MIAIVGIKLIFLIDLSIDVILDWTIRRGCLQARARARAASCHDTVMPADGSQYHLLPFGSEVSFIAYQPFCILVLSRNSDCRVRRLPALDSPFRFSQLSFRPLDALFVPSLSPVLSRIIRLITI